MYATIDDIISLHGSEFLYLVANRGDEQTLDGPLTSAAVNDALEHASSECNSYLSRRYMVPVTPVPRILQNAAINISIYQLASTSDRMTDIIRERYRNAIHLLKDLGSGAANLPIAVGQGTGEQSEASSSPELTIIDSNKAVFKRGRW